MAADTAVVAVVATEVAAAMRAVQPSTATLVAPKIDQLTVVGGMTTTTTADRLMSRLPLSMADMQAKLAMAAMEAVMQVMVVAVVIHLLSEATRTTDHRPAMDSSHLATDQADTTIPAAVDMVVRLTTVHSMCQESLAVPLVEAMAEAILIANSRLGTVKVAMANSPVLVDSTVDMGVGMMTTTDDVTMTMTRGDAEASMSSKAVMASRVDTANRAAMEIKEVTVIREDMDSRVDMVVVAMVAQAIRCLS